MRLVVDVTETFTSGGSSTLTVDYVSDDNSALSSPTVLATSGAIAKATLVAGYRIMDIALPSNAEEFLGMNYTVATGPFTAGKVKARIVWNSDSNHPYTANLGQ
jgi:hypothetical protein